MRKRGTSSEPVHPATLGQSVERRVGEGEDVSVVSGRSDELLALLAEAGTLLGSSLDYEEMLRQVALLLIPRAADWTVVYTTESDGGLRRLQAVAGDPAESAILREMERRFPITPDYETHPAVRVIRTGEPLFLPEVPDDVVAAGARDAEHLALLRRIGTRSAIAVPIQLQGRRPVGALVLVFGSSGRRYGKRELTFARELAGRIGMAAERGRHIAILESIADGFVAIDAEWRYTYVNTKAAEILKTTSDALLGRVLWEVFPSSWDSDFGREFRRAMREQVSVRVEGYSMVTGAWTEARVYPAADGLSIFFQDISTRKRAEERHHFLSLAGEVLGSSLDYETTLTSVARLAVPTLADWCVVDLVAPDGSLELMAVAHVEPEKVEWARAVRAKRPQRRDAPYGAAKVIRTGEPEFIATVTDDIIIATAISEDELATLRGLGLRSFMCVPMAARGEVLGAISFATTVESKRRYEKADLALATDLARRAAAAIDNARLYTDAVEANASKARFLAVMSHELRTPLTAVIGYTELLADEIVGPLSEAQKDPLARIKASGTHLLTLIEEILAFARIEAGQEMLRLETVDLTALAHEAVSVVEPLMRGKRLSVTVAPADGSPTVRSDPGKVRQVLLNLLANAIKFTESGEITVQVARREEHAVITVLDTGIGIPTEHLERIFEAFWQVEQTTTRKVGGTGLGLSVARQLARLLGGELTVESQPGRGSAFRLLLPSEPPA